MFKELVEQDCLSVVLLTEFCRIPEFSIFNLKEVENLRTTG
jgi:hypothetical protein